jgi:hypothetical protein
VRAIVAAALAGAVLVAAYVALGGGGYAPAPVADPCGARERPAGERLGDGTQRALLATLDGAACDLGSSRETLLLVLLDRDRPDGADDARLTEALRAGVRRARDEGALNGVLATALDLALQTGGPEALIGVLLDGS